MKIVAIYDNLAKTADRYTVLTDYFVKPDKDDPMQDQFMYLGCGTGGEYHSQFDTLDRPTVAQLIKRATPGYKALTHLGRLVPFESLDAATQKHIALRIFAEDN